MSYKKYVKYFSISLVLFLAYHLIVWFTMTSKIFNLPKDYIVGDLARMSYQIDSLFLRKTYVDLNVSHLYKKNYHGQKFDIVTCGDSFFNGGGGGKNPYIQDYIVKYGNKQVLNIINFNPQQSPLYFIENLIEIGWFKKYKPKYFILESVERGVNKFDLTKKFPLKSIDEAMKKIVSPGHSLFTYVPKVKLINTANYKIIYYNIAYKFSNHAYRSVYKFKLKKTLFSINNNNKILIHQDDIKNIPYFTDKNINKLNEKMNDISRKLKKVGVKFIFLVAVDKYDLYRDFLTYGNKYPQNNFFKKFDKLKKDYIFIDTKKILYPMVKSGEKDVFYVDDTHWSYKANDVVAKEIVRDMK